MSGCGCPYACVCHFFHFQKDQWFVCTSTWKAVKIMPIPRQETQYCVSLWHTHVWASPQTQYGEWRERKRERRGVWRHRQTLRIMHNDVNIPACLIEQDPATERCTNSDKHMCVCVCVCAGLCVHALSILRYINLDSLCKGVFESFLWGYDSERWPNGTS